MSYHDDTLSAPSAPPASAPATETEMRTVCGEHAPDRSGRTCDKPKGHDGEHWTYGGTTLTWPAPPKENTYEQV